MLSPRRITRGRIHDDTKECIDDPTVGCGLYDGLCPKPAVCEWHVLHARERLLQPKRASRNKPSICPKRVPRFFSSCRWIRNTRKLLRVEPDRHPGGHRQRRTPRLGLCCSASGPGGEWQTRRILDEYYEPYRHGHGRNPCHAESGIGLERRLQSGE